MFCLLLCLFCIVYQKYFLFLKAKYLLETLLRKFVDTCGKIFNFFFIYLLYLSEIILLWKQFLSIFFLNLKFQRCKIVGIRSKVKVTAFFKSYKVAIFKYIFAVLLYCIRNRTLTFKKYLFCIKIHLLQLGFHMWINTMNSAMEGSVCL